MSDDASGLLVAVIWVFVASIVPSLLLLPILYLALRPKISTAPFFKWDRRRLEIGAATHAGLAIAVFTSGVYWISVFSVLFAFPSVEVWLESFYPDPRLYDLLGPLSLIRVVQGLNTIVAAPIVEEVVFRGLLFRAFSRTIGPVPGLVASSAIFALPHLDNAASAFASGAVLSLLYCKTGSLHAPVFAHITINIVAWSTGYLGSMLGMDLHDFDLLSDYAGIYLLCLVVGGAWVYRIAKPLWPPRFAAT